VVRLLPPLYKELADSRHTAGEGRKEEKDEWQYEDERGGKWNFAILCLSDVKLLSSLMLCM